MSMSLVSTPDLLALTKGGRTVYRFSGSGRLVTSGTPSVNQLFLMGPVVDGRTLTLRWNGQQETFTFRTTPAEATDLPVGDGSPAHADAIRLALADYYPIREDFVLTAYHFGTWGGMHLTARRPGPLYDITTTAPPPFSFNTYVPGREPVLRPRYGAHVEVWLQKPGTSGTNPATDFERVYRTGIEADNDGTCHFDAGPILHPLLRADWPNWTFHQPTGAQRAHRAYYIAWGEAWGSPLRVGRMQTDTIRHAYLGGVDFVNRAGSGYNLVKRLGATAPDDRALRLGGLTRYIRPDEPQYLTFLNQRTARTGVKLAVTLIFDNGDTVSFYDAYAPQALAVGDRITYPTGPLMLGLLGRVPTGRQLREYSVRLTTDTSHLSQVYRYVLNYDYQPYTRYFAFLNSLGCIDTLATVGKGSAELNRFYEQAERELPTGYEVGDGQFIDYNVSVQQQVEVTTGFRPASELQHWTDFYRSAQRFRLRDGQALPIGLISKSIKQGKDGDGLFAHRFDYSYLYRDDFFTAEVDEAAGDGLPPHHFVPAGDVLVSMPSLVRSIDDTVPNVVRGLTPADIDGFRLAASRPNPQTLGYLVQAVADTLYYRQDRKIDFLTELKNVPTVLSADAVKAIATTAIVNTVGLRLRLKSWSGAVEPS